MVKFIILIVSLIGFSSGNNFDAEKFQRGFDKLINSSKSQKKINIHFNTNFPQSPLPIQNNLDDNIGLINKIATHNSLNSREIDWSQTTATHLLNRTMFGPTYEEVSSAANSGLEFTVNELLNLGEAPNPPGDWFNEPIPENIDNFSAEQIDSLLTEYYYRFEEMRSWWIDLILEPGISIREMMVLFWHDHFATSQDKIIIPSTMYKQNELIRSHALGNIKEFVKEMALDPAMILWLDNNQNKVRKTHLNGSFENWTGSGPEMIDEDNDGVYSTTISLAPGYYQYKYSCGDWGIHDNAPDECSVSEQYQNRGLAVNYENNILDEHGWDECSDNVSNENSNVTFYIDMSGIDLQGGSVFITGDIDSWSGMGLQLEHSGNNIYSGSYELSSGQYEYLITVTGEFDDWSGWGMVDNPEQGSNCDFNPNDQWANYGLAVANGLPLNITKTWNECQVNGLDNLYEITFNLTEPPCPEGINENFARELLELFTIGIGNYTQEDIIKAARAYSGYTTDGLNVYFNPEWHDYNNKTFMGQTGNWDGDDIVDIIFEQEETSKFFARKIYKWFLYETPNENIVSELAEILVENNFEISPMLDALFSSDHFYDLTFKGSSIKSTLWHTIGTVRKLYINEFEQIEDDFPKHGILIYFQNLLGQAMFLPPDVSGWLGYRTWINTYTLPWRKTFAVGLVDGQIHNFDIGMQMNALEFVQHFPAPDDAEQLVEDVYIYLLAMEPTEQVKDLLLQELLQGFEPYNWNTNIPSAEIRIRNLVKLTMKLSDYQLQ